MEFLYILHNFSHKVKKKMKNARLLKKKEQNWRNFLDTRYRMVNTIFRDSAGKPWNIGMLEIWNTVFIEKDFELALTARFQILNLKAGTMGHFKQAKLPGYKIFLF